MVFPVAPVVGAIGAIGGAVIGSKGQESANETNLQIARETNMMNAAIARRQMEFQERMSSTAWQRGVADMREAGINPLLSVSQGGASSPQGSAVAAQTGAPMRSKWERAQEAFTSAVNAAVSFAQLKNIQKDTEKKQAEIHMTDGMVENLFADQALKMSNARKAEADARYITQQLKNSKYLEPGLKTEAEIDSSMYGAVTRALQRANPFMHSGAAVAKAVR